MEEIRISFLKQDAITKITPATPILGVYRWVQPIPPFRLLTNNDLPNLTANTVLKIEFGNNPLLGYSVGSDFIFVNRSNILAEEHGFWKYNFQNHYISSQNTLLQMIAASKIYTNLPPPPVAPAAVAAAAVAGLPTHFNLIVGGEINMGPNPRAPTAEEIDNGCNICQENILPPNTKLYLDCRHTFCGNCVNRFNDMVGASRNKCPYCNTNINFGRIYTRPQIETDYFLVGGKKQLGGGKKQTSKKRTSKKQTSKKRTSKKQTSKKRTSKKQTGGRRNSKKASKKSSKRTSKRTSKKNN